MAKNEMVGAYLIITLFSCVWKLISRWKMQSSECQQSLEIFVYLLGEQRRGPLRGPWVNISRLCWHSEEFLFWFYVFLIILGPYGGTKNEWGTSEWWEIHRIKRGTKFSPPQLPLTGNLEYAMCEGKLGWRKFSPLPRIIDGVRGSGGDPDQGRVPTATPNHTNEVGTS